MIYIEKNNIKKKRRERRRILLLETFAITMAHGPYTLVVCAALPWCLPKLDYVQASHRCSNLKVSSIYVAGKCTQVCKGNVHQHLYSFLSP